MTKSNFRSLSIVKPRLKKYIPMHIEAFGENVPLEKRMEKYTTIKIRRFEQKSFLGAVDAIPQISHFMKQNN